MVVLLLLLLRQKASPNDNHLRLSNATLGRATQRCNILCVCGCMQGEEAARRAASWQGFLFLRVGPQQWHMNALPRAHITSSSAALFSLSLSHTHALLYLLLFYSSFIATFILLGHKCPQRRLPAALATASVAARAAPLSPHSTLSPPSLSPPFFLSASPSPTRIHNLDINLISLLCMSAKKLSPSPGRFLQLAS